MPRPKKSERDEMATVKIENAFWSLLEKERFSDITVLRISQEAATNRNSFYYHYRDISDLAQKAFLHNANNEVSKILISVLLSAFREDRSAPVFDLSILPYSKRIMLCARSDSPYLKQMVHDLLKQIWFDSMSIKETMLSAEEKLQVNFIFAGLVAVLGSKDIMDDPLFMTTLSRSEIGKAIITTMKKIAATQSESSDRRV